MQALHSKQVHLSEAKEPCILTIQAAIDEVVPAHVLTAALYERFSSRGKADYADKVLSAMRYEFGGHVERPTGR